MTTNTLPMINFTREFGWNPVEANLLGASAFFSGDTPTENVLGSVQVYQLAHGILPQKPKFCSDKTGRVVSCDSKEAVPFDQRDGVTNDPSKQDPKLPQTPDGYTKRDIWADKDGNIVPPNTPGATQADLYGKDAGVGAAVIGALGIDADDLFKRITFVVIGIVILAVALVSLR